MVITLDRITGVITWTLGPANKGTTIVRWRSPGPGDTDTSAKAREYIPVSPGVNSFAAEPGYKYGGRLRPSGPWVTPEVFWPADPVPPPVPPVRKVVGLVAEYEDDALLADARALGAQAVRIEVDADGMTNKGISLAAAVQRTDQAGVGRLILVNDYRLGWSDPQWVPMAVAAAAHTTVGMIEPGNEAFGQWFDLPNTPGERPGRPVGSCTDPVGYGAMLERVLSAVAPLGVGVLISAISYYDDAHGQQRRWLDDVFTGGPSLRGHPLVAIALHNYPNRNPSWDYGTQLQLVHSWYPDVPIWITEVGMKSNDYGTAAQATFVTKAYGDLKAYDWLRAVFYYCQRDGRKPVLTGIGANDWGWGLIDYLGRPKLAHEAFRAAAAA